MIEALNDPATLDNTPIGTIRVVEWAGTFCVAIMSEHDNDRIKRIVHQLTPGENPLCAVYGKRTFERAAVKRAYDNVVEQREKRAESFKRDHSKDFRKEIKNFLSKRWDGSARDAVLVKLTRPS
jgi:hypothetical protein